MINWFRKWHTINWARLAAPKDLGGLGIRDSSSINLSLLGKLIWSLLHHHDKLWVQVLRHKYLQNDNILHTSTTQGASFIWKSIIKSRDALKDGFVFSIGSGQTSFWHTNWTGNGFLADLVSFVHIHDS